MMNESTEPHDSMIDVINVYKKDVDRTLLRENLKLSVDERLRNAETFHRSIEGWREAGKKLRARKEPQQ